MEQSRSYFGVNTHGLRFQGEVGVNTTLPPPSSLAITSAAVGVAVSYVLFVSWLVRACCLYVC